MADISASSALPGAVPKQVTLCADDFGMSDGVDSGTVELVRMGRIHAVSCLTAPRRWPMAAQRLRELPSEVSIGLHLTLTAIPEAGPTAPGAAEPGDPGPAGLILRGLLGRLDRDAIAHRLRCQLDLFEDGLGRPPDHLDGHQHAQAVFGIPDLLHEVLAERYGAGVQLAGTFAGTLSNNGEQLTLLAFNGDILQRFAYDDTPPWPTRADL